MKLYLENHSSSGRLMTLETEGHESLGWLVVRLYILSRHQQYNLKIRIDRGLEQIRITKAVGRKLLYLSEPHYLSRPIQEFYQEGDIISWYRTPCRERQTTSNSLSYMDLAQFEYERFADPLSEAAKSRLQQLLSYPMYAILKLDRDSATQFLKLCLKETPLTAATLSLFQENKLVGNIRAIRNLIHPPRGEAFSIANTGKKKYSKAENYYVRRLIEKEIARLTAVEAGTEVNHSASTISIRSI